MWIVDPACRFRDGVYHVEYGAVGMMLYQYLRWRWVAKNAQVQPVKDRIGWFGEVTRTSVEVDWEEARRVANSQAWDWLPKIYGWIDKRGRSGEEVLAEMMQLGQRADAWRKSYEQSKYAAMKASTASREKLVDRLGQVIFVLEGVKIGAGLGLAAVPAGVALAGASVTAATAATVGAVGIGGKALMSGADVAAKSRSLRCGAFNVGVELALEVGKEAGGVGTKVFVVAKGLNKGIASYVSGEQLGDSVVDAVVESGLQLAGSAASSKQAGDAIKSLMKKLRGQWMVPLGPLGELPKKALDAAGKVDGDAVKKLVGTMITEGGNAAIDGAKAMQTREASGASQEVQSEGLLIADAARYETMIRRAIYKRS